MKKLKTALILLGFLTCYGVNAQKKTETGENLKYQLEFKFTGEVSTELDSTFLVFCVIDADNAKNFDNLIAKTGKNTEELVSKRIDLNDKSKVIENKGKLSIELGKAGEDLSVIELEIIDKNGNLNKLTQLQNIN